MDICYTALALSCAVLVSVHGWKMLNWVWLRPKRKEKQLRQQGFNGRSYRFLFGDFQEIITMIKEAKSKPITLSNDIIPRVLPFIHESLRNYGGRYCFMWFGPTPRVIISDPELIKEVLSRSYVFQKPYSPLGKPLAREVASYETEKWAKHRKLINPTFHLEKLKNMLPSFHSSSCKMLSKWDDNVLSEGSSEVDVWPCLQTLTSDAISRTAFGSNYEGRKIFELQKEQFGHFFDVAHSFTSLDG